ncbi:MAG: hypothetical protein WAU86_15845, partial [Oricola sp.]
MTDATNRKLDVDRADDGEISRDDPLFELSQIIGYSRPAERRSHADEPEIDLESELLRELETFSGVLPDEPEAALEPEIDFSDDDFEGAMAMEAAPALEPQPSYEPVAEYEPAAEEEAAPEAAYEPELEAAYEPEAEIAYERQAEAAFDVESEMEAEVEADFEPAVEAELEPAPEPDLETAPEYVSEPEIEPVAGSEQEQEPVPVAHYEPSAEVAPSDLAAKADSLEAELMELLGGIGEKVHVPWTAEAPQAAAPAIEEDEPVAVEPVDTSPQVPASAPLWFGADAPDD